MSRPLKIIHIVEATTMNAVAKVVLEFFRTSRELRTDDLPLVEGSIVTFNRGLDTEASNEFVTAARAEAIEIDVIPERRRFDLKAIPTLRSIIGKRQPDVIVTNSVKSHFILWRSRLWQKFPWVAFHHGYTATDRKMRVYNRLDRWSLPKADCVITVCHAFARELAAITKIPEGKIFVQQNSVRPVPRPSRDELRALRQRLAISEEERVILSVGRLSKEKAHSDLIAAFEHLARAQPEIPAQPEFNVQLVIVGAGPEIPKLASAARASAWANRITFAGHVADVQPFYGITDVFVLPSHSEGSPNVLLEAMAARLPIVATAVGGVPEIVTDESALLVPPKNPLKLAAAIEGLLSDDKLATQLANNAAVLVEKNHAPAQYVRNVLDIYRSAVAQRKLTSS